MVRGAGVWAVFVYLSFQRVANHLAAEQAKSKLEARIKIDPKIEVRNLGSVGQDRSAYDVRYSYDITITSASSVTIEVASLEWFKGHLKHAGTQSFRANLPNERGSIHWDSLGIQVASLEGYDAASLVGSCCTKDREVRLLQDAEVVGVYGPGEVTSDYQTIHLEETADGWVGFVLFIGVRKRDGSLEQYYDQHHVHLAVAAEKGKPEESR
jgi:hypothetical protein